MFENIQDRVFEFILQRHKSFGQNPEIDELETEFNISTLIAETFLNQFEENSE